jgi:hypothetical protein
MTPRQIAEDISRLSREYFVTLKPKYDVVDHGEKLIQKALDEAMRKVREDLQEQSKCDRRQVAHLEATLGRLTAPGTGGHPTAMRDGAIEECAKVVEGWAPEVPEFEAIAAEIRQKKSQPAGPGSPD